VLCSNYPQLRREQGPAIDAIFAEISMYLNLVDRGETYDPEPKTPPEGFSLS